MTSYNPPSFSRLNAGFIMSFSFYWHDYETWGADPRWDRPCQFAGLRSDADLNPIGKPLVLFARPSDDILPHPEACLVTGITPQQASREGVCEAEFFNAIHAELSQPETCALGYNTLRFDDEFTRYGFYRNFYDPYAREWQNGSSRWDIIDMVRLTHALRPEGIEWPSHDSGVTSFRLEDLTRANDIAHEGAHDALADVYATIAVARLIKERQLRLFDFAFSNRGKHQVAAMLGIQRKEPVLHVSSMYPASRGCIAMVAPLAKHPTNPNGVIVYDLAMDPTPLLTLSPEEIRSRLFTRSEDLPEGVERIPLKTVHINKCPIIAPLSTLSDQAAERWKIDRSQCQAHLEALRASPDLAEKIALVHNQPFTSNNKDPDGALYDGFFNNGDRRRIEQVRDTPLEQIPQLHLAFDDPRLPELFFRYRARNLPHSLKGDDKARWEEYRRERLTAPAEQYGISLASFRATLARMMIAPELTQQQREMLSQLADWPEEIGF
jgi:exodeoxyribonuclease-1